MSDYAIIQLAQALAPALGLLGIGGIAVSLTIILRSTLGRRSAKRLSREVEEIEERLSRVERNVRSIAERSATTPTTVGTTEDGADLRRRLETLETIVVDKELDSR